MLLPLLKRKELDSKTFSNDEIILGNFKGKESLPLANRGNTFVSLRGVLEILSKTELSSDIVDNFQDEVFGHLLPYGAVFDTPSHLCYKSQLSRGTRGQKTSNLQKSRTNPLTPLIM